MVANREFGRSAQDSLRYRRVVIAIQCDDEPGEEES